MTELRPYDGLYTFQRKVDLTPQGNKILSLPAYNQLEDDFGITYLAPEGNVHETIFDPDDWPRYLRSWSMYARWMFIQDDFAFALGSNLCLDEDDNDIIPMGPDATFTFPDPGVSSGTITNVAVHAYIRGMGKTILKRGATSYYGTGATKIRMGWAVTNYPTDPAGGAWAWSDLAAGTLKAGVWLEVGDYTTSPGGLVPYGYQGWYGGTLYTCCREEGCTWPPGANLWGYADARYNLAYKVKVVIDYTVGGVPQTPITLWPTGDDAGTLAQCVDKPLDIDLGVTPAWSSEEQFGYSLNCVTSGSSGRVYHGIQNLPPVGATINNVKILYSVASTVLGTGGAAVSVKPFLKSGSSYNYGTTQSVPYQPLTSWTAASKRTANYTWSTNPFAGGVAWTRDALASIQYGLEFSNDTGTIKVYVYYNHLDITHSTSVVVHNTVGPLTGPSSLQVFNMYPAVETLLTAAGTKRYSSQLSVLPKAHSIINSLKVSYAYSGYVSATGGTIRPFLYIYGSYYYGDTQQLSTDPSVIYEYDYTWTSNPKGGAWQYSDLFGIRFGLELYSASGRKVMWIHKLECAIDHDEVSGLITTEFEKISARFLSYGKVWQDPITADRMLISMQKGSYLPERSEIMLFKDGYPAFLGFVWGVDEQNGGDNLYTIIGQQALLDYRFIPATSYSSGTGLNLGINYSFDDGWEMNNILSAIPHDLQNVLLESVFSDDLPTYPNHYYVSRMAYKPYANYDYYEVNGYQFHNQWPSMSGLFFLINSYVPSGQSLSGTLPGFAKKIQNRPVFTTNHNQSLSISDTIGEAWTVQEDNIGGIKILQPGPSASPMPWTDYYYDEFDLKLRSPLDNRILFIDHWADTFIRPGIIDLAGYQLNMPYIFYGQPSKCFGDFASKIQQEIGFRVTPDAYMLFDLVDQFGRGSETAPIKAFLPTNSTISKVLPLNPRPTIIIGIQDKNNQIATIWEKKRAYFIKSFNTSLMGETLKDYLESQLSYDETVYQIQSIEPDYMLRPGDWISIQEDGYAPVSKRIKSIAIDTEEMHVEAGSIQRDLAKRFTESKKLIQKRKRDNGPTRCKTLEDWKFGSGNERENNKGKSFKWQAPGGTTTFVITADDVQNDDWQAKLSLNWSLNDEATRIFPGIEGDNEGNEDIDWKGSINGKYELLVTRIGADPPGVYWCYAKWRKLIPGGTKGEDQHQTADRWGEWSGEFKLDGNLNHWNLLDDSLYYYAHSGSWISQMVGDSFLVMGQTHEFTTTMDQFLTISLNGKIIPPGRIKADGTSGSIEIDITDFCSTSLTSDTTNTLVVALNRGMNVPLGPIHKMSGQITQYSRVKPVISNDA